jgi:hypothetical protein
MPNLGGHRYQLPEEKLELRWLPATMPEKSTSVDGPGCALLLFLHGGGPEASASHAVHGRVDAETF